MDGNDIALLITAVSSAACLIMTTVVNLRLTAAERKAALARQLAADDRAASTGKLDKLEHHLNGMNDKLIEATRSEAFQKGKAETMQVIGEVAAAAVKKSE